MSLDKVRQNIERCTAIIDLLAALVFLALLCKMYQWVSGFLELLK